MASALDIMNKVFVGLRQDELGSSADATTKYEKLVLQFVNEAKEEIEESWIWMNLRQTVTVTLAQGTSEYTLTAAADADIDTNERSKLLYEKGPNNAVTLSRGFGSQPCMWDVTDTGERRIQEISWEEMERLHFTDNDEQQDPTYFSLLNTGDELKLKVWPTPADARTFKTRIYIPEAELAPTGLTTDISAPVRPIYLLALWKANAERGEEIAAPNGANDLAYRNALSAAIAREQSMHDTTSYPV